MKMARGRFLEETKALTFRRRDGERKPGQIEVAVVVVVVGFRVGN